MMSKYDAETKIWHGPRVPYQHTMDITVGEILLASLCKTPNRILQVCADDDTKLSCEELRMASIRIAQNLQKIGIQEDDIVGYISHHSHFSTAFIYGCIFVGAVLNPLDEQMSEEDYFQIYSESKPKIIVCDDEVIPKLQRALKNVDFDYQIYATGSTSTYPLSAKNFLKPTGTEASFKCPKFSKPSDEKLLVIMCSSGTSGKYKSVCMSHAGNVAGLELTKLLSPPTEGTTSSILFSPLFWATGYFFHLAASVAENDTRIWTRRNFSVDTFIELVTKYQITTALMSPYVLSTLINSKEFLSSKIDCLQNFTVCGSVISAEARRKFDEVLPNRNFRIGFGMTEAGVAPVIVAKPLEYRHGLTVGSVIGSNLSLKIIDGDGNALDNGKAGEICWKSTIKFLGYYNNPEATRQSTDEHGFVKTGDIGYFNDDGMLFIVDRKKDALKYKGMHLNPSEIESVIETMDGVQTVSVVGVPNDMYVHLVTAAVIKKQGFEKLTEREIIDYVAGRLPEFKRLSGGVYFFDEFPTTLNNKVSKRSILEEIIKLQSNTPNKY